MQFKEAEDNMLNRVPHSRGASDLSERGVDRTVGLSREPCIVSSAFSHPHGEEVKAAHQVGAKPRSQGSHSSYSSESVNYR